MNERWRAANSADGRPSGIDATSGLAGLTLAMDAAAGHGTVAVLRDGALVAQREVAMRSAVEERFLPAVVDALAAVGVAPRELARIVCGGGPGSFTSLRVVAATAKGLAQGATVPLYAVPSLALTVTAHAATGGVAGRWLSTLDALRGDRYAAVVTVDSTGALVGYEARGRVPTAEVAACAAELGAQRIGPDEVVTAAPHARGVERCARFVAAASPVDLGGWEPVYGRLAEAQVKWEAAHGRPLG